jgi:hypothetical protein
VAVTPALNDQPEMSMADAEVMVSSTKSSASRSDTAS